MIQEISQTKAFELIKCFEMKTCIIILLVTSLRHVVSAENWIGDSGTLIFASVIYRNGDRTPLSTYPTDPYANPAYWDENWGQLTNVSLSKITHLFHSQYTTLCFLDWQAGAISSGRMADASV